MNKTQLHGIIAKAVNDALSSNQTQPADAIAILESAKMDVYMSMREAQSKIVKATSLPPGRNGE